MKSIEINHINKKNNIISYDFTVSAELSCFFSGEAFVIEYPENIEAVPESVAVVPFVCNVLPIVWLTDSVLVLPELDKDFFESIPKIKNGYEKMFPESDFGGKLEIERIVSNVREISSKSAMFYSGGLDSAQTLVSHFEEKPILLSIWGSDVNYNNREGWEKVHRAIIDVAERFSLSNAVIRSSFREFDNERALNEKYSAQLKDGWWHGVKHGIGLLGHVAPYAHLHGLSKMYIASSFSVENENVRCASDPTIDNYVKFSGCQVIHDGYEFNRQQKIENIVDFCSESKQMIPLHVCWETQEGANCCQCEKCLRTIVGLLVQGADPKEYGFTTYTVALGKMRQIVLANQTIESSKYIRLRWEPIKKKALENEKKLRRQAFFSEIKWILKADFEHSERIKIPMGYRIRRFLSEFKFYQMLHVMKNRLIKGK